MDPSEIIQNLESNAMVFEGLLKSASKEMQVWHPEPEKWSLLIIICHILDEEIEDWRARVQLTLENPENEFVGIHPEKWVNDRDYKYQDYHQKIQDFLKARSESIDWLKSLKNPKWDQYKEHPHFGKMSARLFLENWLIHDLLHIRQIIRLKNHYIRAQNNVSFEYAGNW